MAQDNAYHLSEGLWITAAAPDRIPISPNGGGGGGPGYGGWGLYEGRPRGTGGPGKNLAQEISARRVLDEERQGIDRQYADQYAPLIKKLSAQTAAERTQVRNKANAAGASTLSRQLAEQRGLSALIGQKRDRYLQILPDALSFYGAPSFYKRSDSMMSRIYDPGVFSRREAFADELWSRLERSTDGAYRLHLEAESIRILADDLQILATQLDRTELQTQPVDLAKAIKRRTEQIGFERQVCFECLPNFLQHELVKSTSVPASHSLVQAITAYLASARTQTAAKQRAIPKFTTANPTIKSPLSKPQLEALHHLVAEQKLRRAGARWRDYHAAMTQTESIRYLQRFTVALSGLHLRALQVEALQKSHEAEQVRLRQAQDAARKAEIERKAKEAERLKAEAERKRISYSALGSASASFPLVLPIGTAAFAITQSAYMALQHATRMAVAALAQSAAPALSRLLVGAFSVAWPAELGNSERRYLISTPLADLSPPGGPDLVTLAMTADSVDMPYLLSGSEETDELSLYVEPGGRAVAVRAASFDSERQVFSLALDNPQRILTWTPVSAPGSEQGSSTSLPPVPPGTVVYTGSKPNPVRTESESYPALDLLDQERLIITFPIDSGLPPILVVFKSPRFEPGIASGTGQQITGRWLGEATQEEGAAIPAHIAELLKGREYRNFNAFRRAFWKSIANDGELSKQFNDRDLRRMKKHGYAPTAPYSDRHKTQTSYVLHHIRPISESGGVYDMDNLRIVTPSAHYTIHYGGKQ